MGQQSLRPSRVECICPRCRKTHTVRIVWRGRGKPRIYCKECKEFASCNAHLEGVSK